LVATATTAVAQKSIFINWGVVAGISSTKLQFHDRAGSTSMAPQLSFDKSTNLTGGIFADVKFLKITWLSIHNELTHRSYDASSTDFYGGSGSTQAFGTVTAKYMKYNLAFRAALTDSNVKPFFSLGVSPAFLLSQSNSFVTNFSTTSTRQSLLGKCRSFEMGFFGAVGVLFNRIAIEARIEQSQGLKPENCKSSVNTLYILFSYKLN
jgi:hypothetical protein